MTIVCPQQWGFQIPEGMGSSDEHFTFLFSPFCSNIEKIDTKMFLCGF